VVRLTISTRLSVSTTTGRLRPTISLRGSYFLVLHEVPCSISCRSGPPSGTVRVHAAPGRASVPRRESSGTRSVAPVRGTVRRRLAADRNHRQHATSAPRAYRVARRVDHLTEIHFAQAATPPCPGHQRRDPIPPLIVRSHGYAAICARGRHVNAGLNRDQLYNITGLTQYSRALRATRSSIASSTSVADRPDAASKLTVGSEICRSTGPARQTVAGGW
jgi:hypothetical protein